MKKLLLVFTISMVGCTDATWEKATSFGGSRSIKCYSGGLVIYEGESTGKIQSEQNSDGYYFKERKTGELMEVSGNCVLRTIN